jgi:hypothetical protein
MREMSIKKLCNQKPNHENEYAKLGISVILSDSENGADFHFLLEGNSFG